ncbi:MAG: pyridoxal-phosphate dependent enzyme [Halolamina sp.]
MSTTDAFRGLRCVDCGERHEFDATRCPDCEAALEPTYDLDAVDADALRSAVDGADSMWALSPVLPFPAATATTAAEGTTPLVDAPQLADELGVGSVAVKDESRNPTGTVLDRGHSLAVTAAAATDVDLLAQATPGNGGQSMAAYAGQHDLRSYAFVPSRAPFPNKALTNVHGGEMRVVGGRLDDAKASLATDLAADYYPMGAFRTPYRHEGAKTVAYEVLADRGWAAPDAVVVPASTGELMVGLTKGFREAHDLGLVNRVPRLFGVQPAGCAPIAAAWQTGADEVEPWNAPDTIVGELEVPEPAGGALALEALADADGAALAVEDDAILESAVAVAASATLEVGAAGGAAAAGAWALADGEVAGPADDVEGPVGEVSAETDVDATLSTDDDVVLLNTETAVKTPDILRSHLMGQGV